MQGVPSFPTVHRTVGKFTLCGAPEGCIDLRSIWGAAPCPAKGTPSLWKPDVYRLRRLLFVLIIENIVILSAVSIGAQDKPDYHVHTQHRRSAAADERERNSDYRSGFQHHADIHKAVSEKHTECAHANEPSQTVAGDAAVRKNFQADVRQNYHYADSPHEAENLSHMGKNEVVVKLGNVDVFLGIGKKPLAENSAGLQCADSQILLILNIFRVCTGIEEDEDTLLVEAAEKVEPHDSHSSADNERGGDEIFPGDVGGNKHKAENRRKDYRRSVVALKSDYADRNCAVDQ